METKMARKKFHIRFLFLVLFFAVSACGPQPAVGQEAPASAVPTDLLSSPTPILPTPTQASNGLSQFTKCESQCFSPAWLPDGTQISYFSGADKQFHIVNLKGDAVRVFALPDLTLEIAWSPDGKRMAFAAQDEQRTQTNLTVRASQGNSSRVIFSTPAWISYISWS